MNIRDILTTNTWNTPRSDTFSIISQECSQFLKEAAERPLYKSIKTSSPPIAPNLYKIKVRHKKPAEPTLTELYSVAFTPKLREKALYAYSDKTVCEDQNSLCYIFPVNGYHYLYSKEVSKSSDEYKQVIDTLIQSVEPSKAYDIVTEMLKFTYNNSALVEGIESDAEIMFYNVPYFYAVEANAFTTYSQVLSLIKGD